MAENDEIQAFLKVMANLHALSDLNAAENVANQLIALRKRDQESGTVIYRLTEENASLIRQSKAAAGERRTLDSAVKDLEDRMTQLKKDCTDINKVANERERRLKDKSAKVAQLEQHRVNLAQGSKDEVGTRWSQLWTYINQTATDFFSEDLDEKTAWEAHEFEPSTSHQYPKTFPAPVTNTIEAKQVRIIAVNSIIARALTRHIFRPIGIDGGFATAVSNLAGTNPGMEAFYRSSHLAVLDSLPDYKLSVVNRAVKAAVTEILGSVSCILKDEKKEDFRAHLEDVCKTADREWQVYQRYQERYEVDMDGDKACYDHVPLWKPSSADAPKSNGTAKMPSSGPVQNGQKTEHTEVKTSSAAIVTSVWPLLKVVDITGAAPRISGLALFSDQTRRVEEQVRRENRKASREESKLEDRKSGKRPVSLGAILQSSPKIA